MELVVYIKGLGYCGYILMLTSEYEMYNFVVPSVGTTSRLVNEINLAGYMMK